MSDEQPEENRFRGRPRNGFILAFLSVVAVLMMIAFVGFLSSVSGGSKRSGLSTGSNNRQMTAPQTCAKDVFADDVFEIMFEIGDIVEDVLATEYTGDRQVLKTAQNDFGRVRKEILAMDCQQQYPESHFRLLTAAMAYEAAVGAFLEGDEDRASNNTRLGNEVLASVHTTLLGE